MLDWLKEVITKFTKSKIASFLVEVFSGATGEVINEHYKIVNEYVKNVENIAEFVNKEVNREKGVQSLIKQVEEVYGIKLSCGDVDGLLSVFKGIGKQRIVFELVRDRIVVEGGSVLKKGFEQGINLAIEFAVNRYFGK